MSDIVSFKMAIALRDAGLKLIGDPMYRQHWYHVPSGESGPLLYTDYNAYGDFTPRRDLDGQANLSVLDRDLVFAPTSEQLESVLKTNDTLTVEGLAKLWILENGAKVNDTGTVDSASKVRDARKYVVSFETASKLADSGFRRPSPDEFGFYYSKNGILWYSGQAHGDLFLRPAPSSRNDDLPAIELDDSFVYAPSVTDILDRFNSAEAYSSFGADALAKMWLDAGNPKVVDEMASGNPLPTVPDCYKLTYRIIVPCRYDLARELSIGGGIISGDLEKILIFLGIDCSDYDFDLDAGVLTIKSADTFDDYKDADEFSEVLFRYVKEYVRAEKWAVVGPDRMVLRCGEIEMAYAPAFGIHGKFFHFGFRSLGMRNPMWSSDGKAATFNDCDLYTANRFINLLKMFSSNETLS